MREKTSNSKELREIKKLFEKEASFGRNFSLEEGKYPPDYFLSQLLISSAKFGTYELKKLKVVGVALELLELALGNHYSKYEENSKESKTNSSYNLRLVSGDYYYARAILLVESLGKVVVGTLARAIASFAGACTYQGSFSESDNDLKPMLRKMASLYEASCILGCYLGDVPKKIADSLIEFGLSLGAFRLLKQKRLLTLEPEIQQNLAGRHLRLAKEALDFRGDSGQAAAKKGLYNLLKL